MNQTALILLLFLTACGSQDSLLQDPYNKNNEDNSDRFKDNPDVSDAGNSSGNGGPVKQIQTSGQSSEQLVISWPQIEQPNPFATESIYYEIWHNEIHIDTVATTRYLLPIDLQNSKTGSGHECIRLRAIKGVQQSELSQPMCYTITQAPTT